MVSGFLDRRQAVLGLGAAVAAGRAAAQAALTPAEDDSAVVARARAYLMGLSSAKGRFIQTDARGVEKPGTFYLQRPGRARFEYDPPSGLVVASDGHRVAVVDTRLKTIQTYPLGMTPLGLFLSRDIRIDRGVIVGKVTRGVGGFSIVAHDAKRGQGQITLDFTDPPLALSGWTIIDPQGGATRVRLTDFAPTSAFPASLFVLSDPRSPPSS
jgi:outer membrane lipoprotein-sorting protein